MKNYIILICLTGAIFSGCKKVSENSTQKEGKVTLKSANTAYIRSALSGNVVGIAGSNGYTIFNLDTTVQNVQINNTIYQSFTHFHFEGNDSATLYLIFSGNTMDTASEFEHVIVGIPVIIEGSEPPANVACPKEEHTCESTSDPLFGNLFYCSCCSFQTNTAGCIIGCKCSCESGRCKHTVKTTQGSSTFQDWATPFVVNQSL